MDKKKLLMMGTAMVALSGLPADHAQAAASANIKAKAKIVQAIVLTPVATLDFGSLSAGATGGTVAIATGGARTSGGSVGIISASAHTAGSVKVQAAVGLAMTLKAAAGTVNDGGGHVMVVDTFKVHKLGAGGAGTKATVVGSLTAAAQTLPIGGKLHVGAPAANPAGTYTGTFTVTAAYN